MSSFKQLSKSDVFSIPYVANKQWNFSFPSAPTGSNYITYYQGQNITGSFSLNEVTTSLSQYQRLVYKSINHSFYQAYPGEMLNTSSLMYTLNNYESASSQRPTSSYFNYNDKALKYFPTGSGETIQVFSISSQVFGEKILPYSFTLNHSSSIYITDDGVGNLWSGSTPIGNIYYSQGIAIITSQNHQTITYPADISFQNQYTVYENYIMCKIKESDYNISYNPTLLVSGSETQLKDFATGSDFSPYATSIGMYNENNELLMVAKFAQPLPIPQETDLTIQVRYDT